MQVSSRVAELLPGWEERLQIVFRRAALTLRTLGRLERLRSRLFALRRRGLDLPDSPCQTAPQDAPNQDLHAVAFL